MARYYLKWRSHARMRASGWRNVATRRDVTWRRVGGRCCHRGWRSDDREGTLVISLGSHSRRWGESRSSLWKKRLTNWRRHYCCCRDPGRIRPTTRSLLSDEARRQTLPVCSPISLPVLPPFSPSSTNNFLHPCPSALARTERKTIQARGNERGERKGQRRRTSLDLTLINSPLSSLVRIDINGFNPFQSFRDVVRKSRTRLRFFQGC